MAVYNEILAGRLNRFVQKLLSIKGPTSLVAVSADLRFIHPISSGIENQYLQGWDHFGLATFVGAAGAGNLSLFELRNPPGSGIVGVVTRAFGGESIATNTAFGLNTQLQLARGATTDQNTLLSPIGWDQRGRPAPTLITSSNTAAVTGVGGIHQILGQASAPAFALTELMAPGLEIPVLPGTAVYIQSGNVNVALEAMFWWRERPLEDSEKF